MREGGGEGKKGSRLIAAVHHSTKVAFLLSGLRQLCLTSSYEKKFLFEIPSRLANHFFFSLPFSSFFSTSGIERLQLAWQMSSFQPRIEISAFILLVCDRWSLVTLTSCQWFPYHSFNFTWDANGIYLERVYLKYFYITFFTPFVVSVNVLSFNR